MKLQKLMFFITCLYQRNTGHRLLTESFQPWRYGPVCGAVYGEFKSFGGNPITEYAKDAMGNAYVGTESPDHRQVEALACPPFHGTILLVAAKQEQEAGVLAER